MKNNNKKKRIYRQKVKCPKCNHVFKTRTRAPMITCSWCSSKFKRKGNIITKKRNE